MTTSALDRFGRKIESSAGFESLKTGEKTVVYWMMRDQRLYDNPALQSAVELAREESLPVVIFFWAFQATENRNVHAKEYVTFMCEGLSELEEQAKEFGIRFIFCGEQEDSSSYLDVLSELDPKYLVFDYNPLLGPKRIRQELANIYDSVWEVDAHNIVPVWRLSDKQEFAAHTARRKLHKVIEGWRVDPLVCSRMENVFTGQISSSIKPNDWPALYSGRENGVKHGYASGEVAARSSLDSFVENHLHGYSDSRNRADLNNSSSGLSPYIHFGQLGPRQIGNAVSQDRERIWLEESWKMPDAERIDEVQALSEAAFLEEYIVRRELADNYCTYNENYRAIEGGPSWGVDELNDHRYDPRKYVYALDRLERAQTHDGLWNAAQIELITSGKMHGYMRMYWAKKILEWSESPDIALENAIYLNDFYSIDGRDPNGYVGIQWSITGLHDRPWFNRDIFGKIRYMAESGAKKQFDLDRYIAKWTVEGLVNSQDALF